MGLDLYISFVLATLVLIAMPGPNVALIVSNSVAYGARWGLVTVAGTSSAMVLQLAATIWGLTSLLTVMAEIFEVLRWAGVAYLVYLAWRAFTAATGDLTTIGAEPQLARAIWMRGFAVSLTNPKTLFFYGAFFPQFIDPAGDVAHQFVLLAVTFFGLAIIGDGLWALLAARLRGLLTMHGRIRNAITGTMLLLAGLGLAAARRS